MKTNIKLTMTQGINNPTQEVSPDLFVGHYGFEIVDKPKELVDTSYPSYRLHYVVSGKVTLFFNGKKLILKRRSVFLLIPNANICYQADHRAKTQLYWVTFNGYKAKRFVKSIGLTEDHPFNILPDGKIEKFFYDNFVKRDRTPDMFNLILQRNLIDILDYLYVNRADKAAKNEQLQSGAQRGEQTYIQKILHYIDQHLSDPDLSIRMFSNMLNVHTSTLSRLFKKEMSICFTEYLTLKRIEFAVPMLEEGKMKVNEVARAVGFEDALYFSRVYKKKFHCSPMDTIRLGRKKAAAIKNGSF